MKLRWPNPATPGGALIYSSAGAVLVSAAIEIIHHVHVIWR